MPCRKCHCPECKRLNNAPPRRIPLIRYRSPSNPYWGNESTSVAPPPKEPAPTSTEMLDSARLLLPPGIEIAEWATNAKSRMALGIQIHEDMLRGMGLLPGPPPVQAQKCTCEIRDLMVCGCKCGQLERERKAAANARQTRKA